MAWTEYHKGLLEELQRCYDNLYYNESSVASTTAHYIFSDVTGTLVSTGGTSTAMGVSDSQTINTTVQSRISAIQTELSNAANDDQQDELEELLKQFQAAMDEAKQANESRYDLLTRSAGSEIAAESVMSYPELAKHMLDSYFIDITERYESLESDQSARDDEIVGKWSEIYDEIEQKIDEAGRQAARDISLTYSSRLSQAESELTARGIHSTTIRAALLKGFASAESADMQRLHESILERKTQVLRDTLFSTVQSMSQKSQNQLQLGLSERQWRAESARRLEELYKLAPGIVERRTDTGPGLNDIANLTMNIGRGQAAQQMLGAFQSSQFISPSGGSGPGFDFQNYFQKVITTTNLPKIETQQA